MKSIAALLLSIFLCVQPVYAMSVREPILYADVQEDAGTSEETEAQEEASDQSEEHGVVQGGIEVSAPSAILMESSTGQIIYEKDADTQRPPASVTKVMTLLLIFDALEAGKITLEDEVTTSEYAASMGGSQVFLEPGEVQTVDTMIKCISVASANDACVSFNSSRRKIIRQSNRREF